MSLTALSTEMLQAITLRCTSMVPPTLPCACNIMRRILLVVYEFIYTSVDISLICVEITGFANTLYEYACFLTSTQYPNYDAICLFWFDSLNITCLR